MKLHILNTEDRSACTACGGRCCKSVPGSVHPAEVGLPGKGGYTGRAAQLIRKRLLSGNYVVDWWEGDPEEGGSLDVCYYLRARAKSDPPDSLHNGSWGGECVLFTEGKGCALDFEQRPAQCRSLVPAPHDYPNRCFQHEQEYTKRGIALAWRPYQQLLSPETLQPIEHEYNEQNRRLVPATPPVGRVGQ
jgi:hypothetical protein